MTNKTTFSCCKISRFLLNYTGLIIHFIHFVGDARMSNKKKEISAQSRHEDEVLTRALIWIGGAAVLLLLLLLGNRYYVHYRVSEVNVAAALNRWVLPVLAAVGMVLGAGSIFKAFQNKKADKSMKWPMALGVFFAAFGVGTAALWKFHGAAVQTLCAAIPAAAVLALIYYLYQREFFLVALSSALGIAGLLLVRRGLGNYSVLVYAYLVAAIVAQLFLLKTVRKVESDGGLWKGKQLFHKHAAYRLVYVSCLIMSVMLAACALLGSSGVYFLLFPAVGWLVVMAVYFTVKLM